MTYFTRHHEKVLVATCDFATHGSGKNLPAKICINAQVQGIGFFNWKLMFFFLDDFGSYLVDLLCPFPGER